jgi:hypothetical protein
VKGPEERRWTLLPRDFKKEAKASEIRCNPRRVRGDRARKSNHDFR